MMDSFLKIRGETIKFATELKTKTDTREKALQIDFETLEKMELGNVELIEDKKKELQKFREDKLYGNIIRSTAQWLQYGEKPSKFFCALENHKYLEKTVKRVVTLENKVITDQNQIPKELQKFMPTYSKKKEPSLYEDNLNELFQDVHNIRKLSIDESQQLEGILTEKEISSTLKSMKNGTCLGIDSFPAEFFKVFWIKLKTFVLRALNHAYNVGKMSISLRQCIITCLPKGNKLRQYLKNWRPISLLSVAYKIGSATIANRIKTYLSQLISTTDSGRFIGENTRLIYDIIQYTEQHEIPGLLVLIDFEKAFDSISWKFLYSVLKFLGFGTSILKWIKTFNNDIKATIVQCGITSEFLDIERRCRQGDPISSYEFILCALMITCNNQIKGNKIENKHMKLTQ